jgi:hypothetical protein
MKRYVLATFAVVLAGSLLVIASSQPRKAHSGDLVPEVERIQTHLIGAERALSERNLGSLTSEQRRARSVHVLRLRAYRDRGSFPHNHDFPGERRPYFVDEHGVLCAMAHLISASGRDDIVRMVQRTRNNATVLELAADPEIGPVLAAWLDEAGLTVEEAQRIQPAYEDGGLSVVADNQTPTEVAVASVLMGGVNLATSVMNFGSLGATSSPGWAAYAGVVGGLVGVGLGGAILERSSGQSFDELDDGELMLGYASILVGTVSTLAGISRIVFTKTPTRVAEPEPQTDSFSITAGLQTGRVSGLGVGLRF